MLPEHIRDIQVKYPENEDIQTLCKELEDLELAWRTAEDRLFYDTQTAVRLKHLLRRLRYTSPPDAEAPAGEHRAYDILLETVDAELSRKDT